MRYAIIGMGFIYPRHRQAIESIGGEVVMTCDINPDKKADYLDWQEMLASPKFKDVDAVSIMTPNYLHAPMARACLALGKKVLCEKPLSIEGVEGLEGVSTVLQLRLHPKLQGLDAWTVQVTAKMFRDNGYWDSWKGDQSKSGGILFNLGIHYIDLLIFLLGDVKKIILCKIEDKLAIGEVEFEKGIGSFHIEILDTREGQTRSVVIDGEEVGLSNQDNLSYEDLHKEVYKKFEKGEGVPVSEARKSLELVADLLATNGK